MKNKIRFAITALALVLFAACFFVACSDDVVSGKNNDHSYAEVLESNGAFAYMDKNYETFQDVIDAIAKTGAEGTISVLGNVKSRSVTIPENTHIFIDLGGHEIEFFDVESSAITIGAKATLAAFNGSFSMADKKEDLSVINAAGNGSAVVLYENLTIKAAGQTALLLDAGSTILDKDVVIEGATIARGGKDQTSLMIQNNLSDVRMRGASLVVAGYGCVEITENVGVEYNEFLVAPTATIIDKTGTIDPGKIKESICYIRRGTELVTFGSLREAIETLSDKGETIVFITTEEVTSEEPIALSKSVTIDLNGYSVGTNNIVLADGVDLTIYGAAENAVETAIPSFTGTITSDAAGSSSLILNLVEMNSDINVSRTVGANNSVFHGNISAGFGVYLTESEVKSEGENTVVDITSAFGDIVLADVTGEIGDLTASALGGDVIINNAEATGSLTTGKIKAISHVTLTGSSVPTNEAASLAIGGTVELSGKLTSRKVLFTAAVSAGSIEDVGSTFCDDIAAKGALSFTDSYFDNVKAIESIAGGNIVIKKSYGSVDRVETKAPATGAKATASGYITIDSSEISPSDLLAVGEVKATYYVTETEVYYGDITLKGGIGGDEAAPYLHVSGSVTGKDIKAENCFFNSKNESRSISGNTVHVKKSDFVHGLTMNLPDPKYYSIVATGNDPEDAYSLSIASTMGRTADIEATNGSVCIDNDGEEVSVSLTTGNITAKEAVVLAGKLIDETHYSVNVSGTVSGVTLVASSSTVEDIVSLTGSLTSVNSVFYGTIAAGTTIVDNGSTFKKDITADNDITITGSTFASETETNPAITSTAGDIVLTTVSGKTSTLTAVAEGKSITINNAQATASLTTGAVSAGDVVSITGKSTLNVIVSGSISGITLDTAYVTVNGTVELSGEMSSSNSIFYAAMTASSIIDTGSVFDGNFTIAAEGDISFTNSSFKNTPAVSSTTGDIIMTKAENTAGVTGTVGNLTSITGKVTINTTAALSTGKIIAGKDVSVTGSSSNNVIVRAYEGASVDAATLKTDYAVVNGTVVLTGNMKSQRSVFKDTINADAITDTGSAFEKAIVATDDVVLTGSTFGSTTTSYPAVTSEAGSILMTGVSGTTGALTASGTGNDVTINNKDSGLITTGSITADDAVSLTGRTGNVVTAGAVHAVSLNASYAAVTGVVSLSGDLTSANSVFESAISAATVVDAGSTFKSAILTKANGGGAKFTGSVFASTDEQPVAVLSLSGNIEMTGVTGISGHLQSTLGSVTIYNAQNTAPFETGAIKAAEAVSITGNTSTNVVVGADNEGLSVKASILDIVYVTVNGSVELSGDMSSAYSVFNSTISAISANAIIDNASTFSGTFTITAEEGIVFANTVFENSPAVTSTNSDIEMTKATGLVGALTAKSDVTIDNAKAGATLTTGSIEAGNAVSVTGALLHKVTVDGTVKSISLNSAYAIVGDTVVLSGDLTSSNSTFNGAIRATTVTDTRSTFNNDILARNDVALTGSVFGSDTADVSSVSGSIVMTRVTGTVKTLNSLRSSVTIDNSQSYGTLSTGAITAAEAVTLTGRNTAESLTVAGVTATTLDVTYVTVNGPVKLSDNLTSEKSVFTVNADVTAYAVVATNSTIKGDITAEGDITLENAVLHNTSDIASTNGDIKLTKATGEVGTITASSYGRDVTISNAQATDKLTTGKISAGNAVSVTGNSDRKVTVAGVSGSTLDAVFANFSDDINVKNDVTLTNTGFTTGDADVTSTFGNIVMTKVTGTAGALSAYSVTIVNADETESLETGAITAINAVSVTGRLISNLLTDHNSVTVGGDISGSTLEVVHANVTGAVKLTGNLTSTESIFTGTVSAATITAERGGFANGIEARTGDVKLTGSAFDSENANIRSFSGNIEMTSVTGIAGSLTAANVTIDNAQVQGVGSLRTGVIYATDAVNVTGRHFGSANSVKVKGVSGKTLDASSVTVEGAVALTGVLTSADSTFTGAVAAASVVDERSTFKAINATAGDVTLTSSVFASEGSDVIKASGNILFTKVTGAAGALGAYNVTIDNAEATAELTTGAIAANGVASITGNSSRRVSVGGTVSGLTLNAEYATINSVDISGKLTSADSTFTGAVSAASIEDERSIFSGDDTVAITAKTGDVKLTGSRFSNNAGIASTVGNINLTTVTGYAGALRATNVTIDNAKASSTLYTGDITASEAISVTGSGRMVQSLYDVIVTSVSGSTLDVKYATVLGATLSGALTSSDSIFEGSVSAASVEDERSTFHDDITAKTGDVTLTGSKFNSESVDVTSEKGNIVMTNVVDTAGNLSAFNVAINNAQATGALSTGTIKADGAVTVTGNSYKKVAIRAVSSKSVEASTLDATYAVINGTVDITGKLTSADSEFKSSVSAASIEDERSIFSGSNTVAITAKTGDVTLTGSSFSGSGSKNITSEKGNIEMTKVTGTAGSLTAFGVTIDNAEATAELTTGAIAADGAVTVTGNTYKKVIVGSVSKAATLDVTNVTVSGTVAISGNLISADSEFTNSVTAATVNDVRSTFSGDGTGSSPDIITATTGGVTLVGSKFTHREGVLARFGNIVMTKVSGYAGSLGAYNVTISNGEATEELHTYGIEAVNAISVIGNSSMPVSVEGSVYGEGSVYAAYAMLIGGNIVSATKVTADNCLLGENGGIYEIVDAPTVIIRDSAMKLNTIEADSVTITSPVMYPTSSNDVQSTVGSITTKDLTVTADSSKFRVDNVDATRTISINGGEYGNFTFFGSSDSEITAGVFSGAFTHSGSAKLSITGGFFNSTDPAKYQIFKSGETTIDGTYDTIPGRGWNLKFTNLKVDGGSCYIQSGYFEAADAAQLTNIGSHIAQSTSSSTKYVEIAYTDDEITSSSRLTLSDVEQIKKVIITFYNYPVVKDRNLYFGYPVTDNIELRGRIVLVNDDYRVYSYDRELNDVNNLSIVYGYDGTYYSRITKQWDSANARYYYDYDGD